MPSTLLSLSWDFPWSHIWYQVAKLTGQCIATFLLAATLINLVIKHWQVFFSFNLSKPFVCFSVQNMLLWSSLPICHTQLEVECQHACRWLKSQENPRLDIFSPVKVHHSQILEKNTKSIHKKVISVQRVSSITNNHVCQGFNGPTTFRQKLLWIVLTVVVNVLNVRIKLMSAHVYKSSIILCLAKELHPEILGQDTPSRLYI